MEQWADWKHQCKHWRSSDSLSFTEAIGQLTAMLAIKVYGVLPMLHHLYIVMVCEGLGIRSPGMIYEGLNVLPCKASICALLLDSNYLCLYERRNILLLLCFVTSFVDSRYICSPNFFTLDSWSICSPNFLLSLNNTGLVPLLLRFAPILQCCMVPDVIGSHILLPCKSKTMTGTRNCKMMLLNSTVRFRRRWICKFGLEDPTMSSRETT